MPVAIIPVVIIIVPGIAIVVISVIVIMHPVLNPYVISWSVVPAAISV